MRRGDARCGSLGQQPRRQQHQRIGIEHGGNLIRQNGDQTLKAFSVTAKARTNQQRGPAAISEGFGEGRGVGN